MFCRQSELLFDGANDRLEEHFTWKIVAAAEDGAKLRIISRKRKRNRPVICVEIGEQVTAWHNSVRVGDLAIVARIDRCELVISLLERARNISRVAECND